MKTLVFIDILAAVFVLLGFQLAFRQKAIRAWVASRTGQPDAGAEGEPVDRTGVDSVLRMIGIMIMAFSVTGCAFANLIAYYATHSPN